MPYKKSPTKRITNNKTKKPTAYDHPPASPKTKTKASPKTTTKAEPKVKHTSQSGGVGPDIKNVIKSVVLGPTGGMFNLAKKAFNYLDNDPSGKAKPSPSRMNSYDKDMMHERELICDAKKEIHKEDVAKKKHMHVVSRIAGRNSR